MGFSIEKPLSSQAVALSGKERWMVAPLGARKRIMASRQGSSHEGNILLMEDIQLTANQLRLVVFPHFHRVDMVNIPLLTGGLLPFQVVVLDF